MNEQKAPNGIEWTRCILPDGTRTKGYTHNPIKGCLHECRWTMPDGTVAVCYAEDVAEGVAREAYPHGFDFHYWQPDILEKPLNHKNPCGIFWGSMSDVFGAWVPREQTQACLDVMRKAHWQYHMTLTKNAPNLLNYEFADNVWVGASSPPDFMMGKPLSQNAKERMLARTLKVFKQLKDEKRAKVTWMSIEPLSWDITDILAQHEGALDWAVIGAASSGAKKYAVDHDVLMRVLAELDRQNVPVFFKGNLKTDPYATEHWREDFPTYRVPHEPVPVPTNSTPPDDTPPTPPTGTPVPPDDDPPPPPPSPEKAIQDVLDYLHIPGDEDFLGKATLERIAAAKAGKHTASTPKFTEREMKQEHVAIIGSRDYPDLDAVRAYVNVLPPDTVIVSGGARGVDQVAEQAANARGMKTLIFPADWSQGRGAGFDRNGLIIAAASRVVAFWDGQSRGTKDSIDKARAEGLPVEIINPPPATPTTTRLTTFHEVKAQYDPETRTWREGYVYIGRYWQPMSVPQSVWHNPFKLDADTPDNRRTGVAQYRKYIEAQIKDDPATYNLESLRGKTLVCFCSKHGGRDEKGAPDSSLCHGHVLLDLLSERPAQPEAAPLIPALSIWQPWASLIALGLKRIETRGWQKPTDYRGDIVIHASKQWTQDEKDAAEYFTDTFIEAAHHENVLRNPPLGMVLAVARLVDCVPTSTVRDSITPLERAAGGYEDGRWALILEDVRVLPKRIPMRGQQANAALAWRIPHPLWTPATTQASTKQKPPEPPPVEAWVEPPVPEGLVLPDIPKADREDWHNPRTEAVTLVWREIAQHRAAFQDTAIWHAQRAALYNRLQTAVDYLRASEKPKPKKNKDAERLAEIAKLEHSISVIAPYADPTNRQLYSELAASMLTGKHAALKRLKAGQKADAPAPLSRREVFAPMVEDDEPEVAQAALL